ncbi:MAG: NTP transferase domain-containing protein [Planctomycetota bacterium]|jgi:bifunctional UDP-N-acetylglucosamine pyrophosphorylase/glucosamine-1-phosphate N-acetyltransferase
MAEGETSLAETVAIVLAAGKSTRMKSDLPKVLHEVCGQPMLRCVLTACRLAGVDRLMVVVGHGKDRIMEAFAGDADVTWVEQAQQKGTGHAALCCREELKDFEGNVLVIAGDMPLIRRVTLADLIETRSRRGDALSLATTVLDDPAGYGRIIRTEEGELEAIIEHRDCTDEQLAILEVNPSYYCFDAQALFSALDEVEANPSSGECHITEVVRVLRASGRSVSAVVTLAAEEAMGVNSRLDLAAVARIMQDRIQLSLMNEGVTIVDPDNTWIDADVTVGSDTTVYPFTVIGVGATIGTGCRIGPLATIGAGETLPDGTVVGPSASVGASA